jgi:putative nucleotidyltransferase with HDIG domain
MRQRWGLRLYVGAVLVAGAGALAFTLRRMEAPPLSAWELGVFAGLAVLLDLMVVPLAGGGGASASFAIYFAGLLMLGAGPTGAVAALAGLISEGLVKRRALVRVSFNAAHTVLSLLGAGAVYALAGGVAGKVALTPQGWGAIAAAVLSLWGLEALWVAVAVAFETGARPWRRLRASLSPMLALDGALASVGLLVALLYQSREALLGSSTQEGLFLVAVLVAVALIPAGLLYYAYQLQGHLLGTYAQSLRTLGALMEAKLQRTSPGHGEQVAALAAEMAQAWELLPAEIEQIRYAGYLHDIGKVGVTGALLRRGRDLFEGEPSELKQHPQLGAQILAPIHFLQPAARFVAAHHERWDGLGYMEGLHGKQIPLGARLLAVADAYVGLTGPEASAPLSAATALHHLHQAAGSRFDPEVVARLEEVLRGRAELPREERTAAAAPATRLV